MRRAKIAIGVVAALLPVLYCGGLLYHFMGVGGSVEGVASIGLGPTVLGLAVVGLLFCIPLILKIVRLFARAPSSGPDEREGPEAPPNAGGGGFDAAAAVDRYLANRPAQTAAGSSTAPRVQAGGGPPKPSGFGRKVR